nr:SEC14-like protein 2 [Onthophagus taurus]
MASKLSLDDDQMFALMKFRQTVRDILQPHQNDRYLCRWLRARDWNVPAAEKMFRNSMEWRKQWEVDTTLKTWLPPEPIASCYPSGVVGFDKDKHPVIVIPMGNLDIVGYINSTNKQDLIRLTIKVLEETLAIAQKNGKAEIVAIFDLENINIRQFIWKPAIELIINLLQLYEANYPEILKVCYIINAPKVFAVVYNMIKKVINEYTQQKIRIISTDSKKWQPALQENIDVDVLPKHYGGNATGPNGDPKCSNLVRPGAKIPKEYYKKNYSVNTTGKDFVKATIKRGKKLPLHYMIIDEGCTLHYRFHTEGHDIRFGITYVDENEKEHTVVKNERATSSMVDVTGTIPCQAPATYTVTFDNSYSMFRNKVVNYSIYVSEPCQEVTLDEDCDKICSAVDIMTVN